MEANAHYVLKHKADEHNDKNDKIICFIFSKKI